MRDVMQKGDFSAHIDLASLRDTPHLYALGPVEGLRGEITVFDGQPSVATVQADKVVVERRWPKACFLVYAQVAKWQTVPVPEGVRSLEQLELFVLEAATRAGLDVKGPFPFRVTGSPAIVKYHVVNKTDGRPHTMELHEQAKVSFQVKARPVEFLGFYSDQHHGVFTHHGTNVHVHVRTTDDKASGHVDEITLAPPSVLHLPVR
jgi:acetolactate decarboxylase